MLTVPNNLLSIPSFMFASFWVSFLKTTDPKTEVCVQGVYWGGPSQEQCLWGVKRAALGRGEVELQGTPKASASPLVNSGVGLSAMS